jgi:hypothetical protein
VARKKRDTCPQSLSRRDEKKRRKKKKEEEREKEPRQTEVALYPNK